MSLMAEMNQKALNLGLPISVHLDITYRCNERCVHCYLDHDDHGEMTTAEIIDVLEQLADAGVFFLSLSGGEVLMRRDFFEIVERARKFLFNVKVKTNGVMIGEKEAARLRQLGVEQIQISVYSHRPESRPRIAVAAPPRRCPFAALATAQALLRSAQRRLALSILPAPPRGLSRMSPRRI